MPPKQLIDDVPQELRGTVAMSQAVCLDCANCPVVHHGVDGTVIITNDHNPHAPAVLFTEEQWEELKDHIRTGRIE